MARSPTAVLGSLLRVDRYTLSLTSPSDGTLLPNIGGDPINFTGDLVKDSAGYHLNLVGSAPSVTYGSGDQQLALKNAALKLTLANVLTGDGLKLTASGDVSVGNAVKVTNATINAQFDSTGLLSTDGSGSLLANIPPSGSSPAGTVTGDATFAYTAVAPRTSPSRARCVSATHSSRTPRATSTPSR